jgi:hypothetical protein
VVIWVGFGWGEPKKRRLFVGVFGQTATEKFCLLTSCLKRYTGRT